MLCVTCKIDVNPLFKYAMENNVCPACGGSIMDEESIALIQDIKETISNEIKLRDETVHKVAMLLLSQYNISFRDNIEKQNKKNNNLKKEKIKIASPISMKTIEDKNIDIEEDIIKAEDIMVDGVSNEEREKIMEDVIKKRYVLMDQIQSNIIDNDEFNDTVNKGSLFVEDNVNPVLEAERLNRLAKQQQINSGIGSIRRRT